MRPILLVSAALFLAACGRSEKRFEVETIETFCKLNADCTQVVAAEACVDAIRSSLDSGCDYDPGAAKSCHDALEQEATCEDNGDVGTFTLAYPSVCDQVYPDCGPLYVEPYPPVVTD